MNKNDLIKEVRNLLLENNVSMSKWKLRSYDSRWPGHIFGVYRRINVLKYYFFGVWPVEEKRFAVNSTDKIAYDEPYFGVTIEPEDLPITDYGGAILVQNLKIKKKEFNSSIRGVEFLEKLEDAVNKLPKAQGRDEPSFCTKSEEFMARYDVSKAVADHILKVLFMSIDLLDDEWTHSHSATTFDDRLDKPMKDRDELLKYLSINLRKIYEQEFEMAKNMVKKRFKS